MPRTDSAQDVAASSRPGAMATLAWPCRTTIPRGHAHASVGVSDNSHEGCCCPAPEGPTYLAQGAAQQALGSETLTERAPAGATVGRPNARSPLPGLWRGGDMYPGLASHRPGLKTRAPPGRHGLMVPSTFASPLFSTTPWPGSKNGGDTCVEQRGRKPPVASLFNGLTLKGRQYIPAGSLSPLRGSRHKESRFPGAHAPGKKLSPLRGFPTHLRGFPAHPQRPGMPRTDSAPHPATRCHVPTRSGGACRRRRTPPSRSLPACVPCAAQKRCTPYTLAHASTRCHVPTRSGGACGGPIQRRMSRRSVSRFRSARLRLAAVAAGPVGSAARATRSLTPQAKSPRSIRSGRISPSSPMLW